MRRRALVLLAVVLLALGARAESCRSAIEVGVATTHTTLVLDVRHTGMEAQDARRAMDADGDTLVSAAEVAAWTEAATVDRAVEAPECLGPHYSVATLDGHPPDALLAVDVRADGAEGSVLAGGPLTIRVAAVLDHGPGGASRQVGVTLADLQRSTRALACAAPDAAGGRWGEFDCASVVTVRAERGATIDAATVEPREFRRDWNGAGLVATSAEAKRAYHEHVVSFVVRASTVVGPPASTPAPSAPVELLGTAAVVAGGAAVLALAGAAAASFRLRWGVHGLVVAALYSRLARSDLARHPGRAAILAAAEADPGLALADLRTRTGMSEGTLIHHVRLLERAGLVRTVRDGARRRVFPAAAANAGPYLSALERQLLDAIRQAPGATQKELAAALGVPRDTVAYHAEKLARSGHIEIVPAGRERRHRPAFRA